MNEIEQICDSLDLSEATKRAALNYIDTCDEKGIGNGRSTQAMVAGAIYLVIRQREEPVSLGELCSVTSPRRKEIHNAYREIVNELEIEIKPESPEKYVSEFVTRLNEEFDTNLSDDVVASAKDVLSREQVSGPAPVAVAASAVYIAADLENKKVTQSQIAVISGVSPTTIRKNVELLRA